MTEFADIVKVWREAGIIGDAPPSQPKEFNVAEYIHQQRVNKWREYCPEEFRKKIDRSLIKHLPAWDEADKWEGSFPGLWLWSHETGEGKTRMLWRKYGQFHVRQGRIVVRISGLGLAEMYHDYFNKSATSAFYREFNHKGGIVMLDDLDKMSLPGTDQGFSEQDQSARNARMLRELFDKFYEHHTPVLVTANEDVDWFEQRIGPSGARRMRETTKAIHFA
jgi:hypothetical protein